MTAEPYHCYARRVLALVLVLIAIFFSSLSATAQIGQPVAPIADNLIVVLRESFGANKQDDTLKPMGGLRATPPDGKEVRVELAAFELLADMHVRFVFDGPRSMQNATPEDLGRLGLNPEQALSLAVANIRRVYGAPLMKPWTAGLMQVEGKSHDINSSYFLDRDFWQNLLRRHPEGLVVAVPKRGGLIFAPITDAKAVQLLRDGVAYLHSSSRQMRISSALYLFKDNRWTIYQPPQAQ